MFGVERRVERVGVRHVEEKFGDRVDRFPLEDVVDGDSAVGSNVRVVGLERHVFCGSEKHTGRSLWVLGRNPQGKGNIVACILILDGNRPAHAHLPSCFVHPCQHSRIHLHRMHNILLHSLSIRVLFVVCVSVPVCLCVWGGGEVWCVWCVVCGVCVCGVGCVCVCVGVSVCV